jgi:hypothetical protein
MAAFLLNVGNVTDFDSLAGGSPNATLDTYDIANGSTLRINTDTYQCLNHNTAVGSLDTVNFTTGGGRLLIDPSAVRVLAFNAGTGVTPAIGTVLTQGGVSGIFLGVWSTWQFEPLAVGATVPVTGFIKFKSVSGGTFAAGPIGGISASATGPDVQGWIEVRGADTATITVPRVGAFEVAGPHWFELGTTSGARGQIIPCPTTGTVAGTFPGVWIETAAGSGIYEKFVGVGVNTFTNAAPSDERGKIVWSTTGGIRIGSDGTNNIGYLPPTGCKVRIPAAILTCCTRTVSGSGPRVAPNTTINQRQEFITTNSGVVDINGAALHWYANFIQAFRADIKNTCIATQLILSEITSPIAIDNVIVAPTSLLTTSLPLTLMSCFAGGEVKNSLFSRNALGASGAYCNIVSYCKGILFNNVKTQTMTVGGRTNATTGTWASTQNVDCEWRDCVNIGGRMLFTGDQRTKITRLRYADNFAGFTTSGNNHHAVEFITGCVEAIVDDVDFLGLTRVHPYLGIASFTACYGWKLRNVGTSISPLNFGSAANCGVIFTSGGNNDTGKVQRCYVTNTRTGAWTQQNSDNNITIENVRSDYADTSAILSLNSKIKGAGQTGVTTGQVAVYGTHWADSFTSATVGKIEILCNEPTAASAAQCQITSGTPGFNSSGQARLTVVGQQITWEMPYFAIGHTALANIAPTLTGTGTANLTYEFQYDKGAGYNGTWLTLNAANLTGAGAITPATGVRLKVRATCATANTTNLLTNISIPTVTTSTDQSLQYPLDVVPVTVTVKDANTGAAVGNARVLIEAAAGGPAPVGEDILSGLTNASGVISGTAQYTGQPVIGKVRRASNALGTLYKNAPISATITSTGLDVTVLLIPD